MDDSDTTILCVKARYKTPLCSNDAVYFIRDEESGTLIAYCNECEYYHGDTTKIPLAEGYNEYVIQRVHDS